MRFFKQIRLNLLYVGRTKMYFKYAIGEIVLVIIGILLALQIDSWNDQRIDSLQENEILLQLKDEYASNLIQLNQKIDIRNLVIHSCFQLLSYRNDPVGSIEIDSFNLHLSRLYSRPTFDPALGVSSELSSSGKLYLLKNHELRNLITTWPSYLIQLGEEEISLKEWVENRFIPFQIKNYQIGSTLEISLTGDENFNSIAFLSKTDYPSLTGLFEKAAFDTLLKHPDFEDHLALLMYKSQYGNTQSIGVKNQLNKIILSINTELKKKME